MINRKIKGYVGLILVAFLLVVLINLTQTERLSTTSDSTLVTESSNYEDDRALKIWWDKGFNYEEDKSLQDLVKNWEQKTGKKIKLYFYNTDELFQKLERELRSGHLPDLIAMFKSEKSLTARLAWEGKLADVSDVIEPVKNQYTKTALATIDLYNNVEKKQSYYSVPIHQATIHVYYWRDLLKQAGYTEKDIPQEWDAFWQFWTKVQQDLKAKKGLQIYGLGLPLSVEAGDTYQTFEQLLAANNVSMLNAKGELAIDRPEVRQGIIKVLNWYKEFYQKGYMSPEALHWLNPDNNRSIINRQVLMTTNDTLSISAALKLGMLEFPPKPDGKPMPYLITVQQVILLADSDKQAAAKDFLSYLIRPEINGKFLKNAGGRHSPVLNSVWKDPFWTDKSDPHISLATHTLKEEPQRVYYTFQNPAYSIVLKENVWGQALQKVLANGVKSEQAANEALAQIKQIFAEWQK
jgi:multiple sugar transport system substrate-binding protein